MFYISVYTLDVGQLQPKITTLETGLFIHRQEICLDILHSSRSLIEAWGAHCTEDVDTDVGIMDTALVFI
jgi:hypothetical protein